MPDENAAPLPEDQVEFEAGKDEQVVVDELQMPDNFIYSNIAAVGFSQLDFRITFAEVLPNGKFFTRVGIVMPPEHAAALALVLIGHARAYEERCGPIRLKQWQDQKTRATAVEAALTAARKPNGEKSE